MNLAGWLCIVAGLIIYLAAFAQGAAAGRTLFQQQCSVCHSDQAGVNGFGPSLAGIVGRKAAGTPGFDYTSALRNSGLTWDPSNLDQFLADSAKKVSAACTSATRL